MSETGGDRPPALRPRRAMRLHREAATPLGEVPPMRPLVIPGREDLQVSVQDHSVHPYSHTWKDLPALELASRYKRLLGEFTEGPPREISFISAGSMALAVARIFKEQGLPMPRVLVDRSINPALYAALVEAGCKVFVTDLGETHLSDKKILKATKNKGGITLNDPKLSPKDCYQSSFQAVLERGDDYIFMPSGSNTAYNQMLSAAGLKKVLSENKGEAYVPVHILGAMAHERTSKADKLYTAFRPANDEEVHQVSETGKRVGALGELTDIYPVEEEYLEKAMEIFTAQGINAEYSAVAGLALLLQMEKQIPEGARVVIVSSGQLEYKTAA